MHMPSVGSPPSYAPVAIFVGGTSGIGQVMAEAFARYTKGNAHIVIVGRNRAFAESIIENLPKPTVPNVTHEFVQCEATLMRNVHATTTELLSRVPKINFLIMSPGALSTRGRDETEEGIDKQLAVDYYARWMFTNGLMPALLEAKNAGEDVKVFSVLAAGEGREELDGPGPEKKFIFKNAGLTAITYDDLLMEVTVFIVEKHHSTCFPIRNSLRRTQALHLPMPTRALSAHRCLVPQTPSHRLSGQYRPSYTSSTCCLICWMGKGCVQEGIQRRGKSCGRIPLSQIRCENVGYHPLIVRILSSHELAFLWYLLQTGEPIWYTPSLPASALHARNITSYTLESMGCS
jgi:NAD(P)-dependent dehydrogenase (short-subunit alcohol dehydrogenase family)